MGVINIGIPGMEKIFPDKRGTLPTGSWTLAVGEPGSWKTIFIIKSVEFLMSKDWYCVYVSTEMRTDQIIEQAESLGYDWGKRSSSGHLIIIDVYAEKNTNLKLTEYNKFAMHVKDIALRIKRGGSGASPTRLVLVIDSIASFWENKPSQSRLYFHFIRRILENYFDLAWVASQIAITTNQPFGFGIAHLCDGIFFFRTYIKNGEMKNCMICTKFRARKVVRRIFSIDFSNEDGLSILDPVPLRGTREGFHDVFKNQD